MRRAVSSASPEELNKRRGKKEMKKVMKRDSLPPPKSIFTRIKWSVTVSVSGGQLLHFSNVTLSYSGISFIPCHHTLVNYFSTWLISLNPPRVASLTRRRCLDDSDAGLHCPSPAPPTAPKVLRKHTATMASMTPSHPRPPTVVRTCPLQRIIKINNNIIINNT